MISRYERASAAERVAGYQRVYIVGLGLVDICKSCGRPTDAKHSVNPCQAVKAAIEGPF